MSLYIDNETWFQIEIEKEPNKWEFVKKHFDILEASDELNSLREQNINSKYRLKYVRVNQKIFEI